MSQRKSWKTSTSRNRRGITTPLVIFLSSILGFGALPLFITGQIPASASVAPSNAVTRFANSNATLYVSTVGKDTNNTTCSQTQPCLTIATAINNASSGDVIVVEPGTYDTASSGTIDISKDVTIQGSGASSTFVGGTSYTDTVNGSVFSIKSSSIKATISGMTIRFGKTAQGTTGRGPIGGGSGGGGGGIYNAGNLTITNDTITDNSTGTGGSAIGDIALGGNGGSGAGIYNAGTLIANSDIISNNKTGIGGTGGFNGFGSAGGNGGDGGGIYNSINAIANLSNDTISYNSAGNGGSGGSKSSGASYGANGGTGGNGGSGAGIYNAGILTATNNTISNNTSGFGGAGGSGQPSGTAGENGSGGGIYNYVSKLTNTATASGRLVAVNDTISNNTTYNQGAGIYNGGSFTATNDTISHNVGVSNNGGGIYNTATLTLAASIIADQQSGSNCSGNSITDAGYNLTDDSSCGLSTTNHSIVESSKLSLQPLANNGGPTQTIAVDSSSPAYNQVPVSTGLCGPAATSSSTSLVPAGVTIPSTDQRGYPRPTPGQSSCSIGAYQFNNDPIVTSLTPSGTYGPGSVIEVTGSDFYGGTGSNAIIGITIGGTPITNYQVTSDTQLTITLPTTGLSTDQNTPLIITNKKGSTPPVYISTISTTNTLYVSQGGSDTSNIICSKSSPCATIGHAISIANNGDTIMVEGSTATNPFNEPVAVSKDLTIEGQGANSTFVGGTSKTSPVNGSVFTVDTGVTAMISGMTIQFGKANVGGGINNNGTLTATNDTIAGNQVSINGGGINNYGTLTATNDTITNNKASNAGGGLANFGTLTATNDTITNNTSYANSGGILNFAYLTLAATIIANQHSGSDCDSLGIITDAGYNLDSDGTCDLSTSNNSFPNTAITLPTTLTQIGNSQVIEVVPPSPAYDVIPVSSKLCTGGTDLTIGGVTGINIPSTDQVGDPRVVPGASYCSIGAYQYQPPIQPTTTITPPTSTPPTTPTTPNPPTTPSSPSQVPNEGYLLAASDGGVFAYGSSSFYGSANNIDLNKPVVAITSTTDSKGYWLVASDGGVFSYGDARFYGSANNIDLNKPIVGMTSTPDSKGYWLVASDGGVFAYGDAKFYGSATNITLNRPIVGIISTSDGRGYWLVASDGGVFAYGDATYYGSANNIDLNKPIVGITSTPDSKGYWLVASDGGVFA
ncbi:MAG: hypothetical protein M0019_10320, partial [Actinomycetota bacterium]|nr:hypothetical protein [Actinomycetota bacterium]